MFNDRLMSFIEINELSRLTVARHNGINVYEPAAILCQIRICYLSSSFISARALAIMGAAMCACAEGRDGRQAAGQLPPPLLLQDPPMHEPVPQKFKSPWFEMLADQYSRQPWWELPDPTFPVLDTYTEMESDVETEMETERAHAPPPPPPPPPPPMTQMETEMETERAQAPPPPPPPPPPMTDPEIIDV